MKWRTKKRIYQYNNYIAKFCKALQPVFIGTYLSICMVSFILINGVLLYLGKDPIGITIIFKAVLTICVTLSVLFVLMPYGIERLAKLHSFKKVPILFELDQIRIISQNYYLTQRILKKIEASFLKEENYPITENTIKFYEEEINHICKIIKNKKNFEPEMIAHVTSRARRIGREIVESIEIDEEIQIQAIKARKTEIEYEWAEIYGRI